MGDDLGSLVRDRREGLGLDQAALAAAMGVGQQTVSKWERGASRPRRPTIAKLAKVLNVAEADLVSAATPRSPEQQSASTSGPVRPLTRTLPVHDLPEERFEDLTVDLMQHMHPSGHASRFGGRGHTQDGIDVLVADPDAGVAGQNLATAQCKRHQEFGPKKVADAIAEVAIKADRHYLFLSRLIASPAARKEAAKHADWELWDGEDISRYIRSLPTEAAVRIVDSYFPGHRGAFLGIDSPGPWLEPATSFDLSTSTIFNHHWALVGRTAELDDLASHAYGPGPSLSVLAGPGGIGKSRLLKALAAHDSRARQGSAVVKVLPGAATVTPSDFEHLPPGPGLTVIVDDAHEATDLCGVLRGVWSRNAHANVVLATRPYGRDWLLRELQRSSLLPDAGARIDLVDLDRDDAESLAREALGPDAHTSTVARLAALTTDSPITTVVGGTLIRRGQLDPAALEQDEDVRDAIMRGFADALMGDPLAGDPSTRRSVLEAVAAMQPFRTDDTTARDAIAAIVGQPYDQVNRHLRSLENAGVLRRRGSSLRIVPDLLGDVVLADAAYDRHDPLGTGYLARIEPLVTGASAENLFVNVCRVDWQIKQRRDDAHSLTDSLWSVLNQRFEAADVAERVQVAELLAKVAYFQPARALRATRWLMDHPTDKPPSGRNVRALLRPYAYDEVLHALPAVHARAALEYETLDEALNQLWDLARNDDRPTNQYHSHPLRVLCDIAEIRPGKPIAYLEAVIDNARTWFSDDLPVSPFDVLEPLLATEGATTRAGRLNITFQPFLLDAQSVKPLRARVIDLAFVELASPNLRRAARAAKTLESALRLPFGTHGRAVTADEHDLWTPEILDTIGRLAQVVEAGTLDPAILVAVRQTLHWHASYSTSQTGPAARAVLDAMPQDVASTLALVLHDGWGHLIRDEDDDYDAMDAKLVTMLNEGVQRLSEEVPAGDIVPMIVARLDADSIAFGPREGHAGPMLGALIEARPELAPQFVEAICSGSAPALEPWLGVVLGQYAAIDPTAAIKRARDILASGQPGLRRGVAHALSGRRGRRELADGELELLVVLAADPDPVMRQGVVRAAQSLARSDNRAAAVKLLAAVRFGDSTRLANDLFMSFHRQVGITWSDFSTTQVDKIRQDLVKVDDIGEHSTWTALVAKSEQDPEWVVSLLQQRIVRAETIPYEPYGYRALPYRPRPRLNVRQSSQIKSVLTGLLEWIAENAEPWHIRETGADLFAAIAGPYDSPIVDVLAANLPVGPPSGQAPISASGSAAEGEPITQADMMAAVVAVIGKAPRTFIWTQPEFVTTALHAAEQQGPDALREMRGALYGATIAGTRSGTPGQPFAEDVEQRDRSQAIADTLPDGSIERRFYLDIVKSAERDIARALEDDLGDGRDW